MKQGYGGQLFLADDMPTERSQMKWRIGVTTALLLITFAVSAQVIEKCDGNVLLSTSKKIGKLTRKDIVTFY